MPIGRFSPRTDPPAGARRWASRSKGLRTVFAAPIPPTGLVVVGAVDQGLLLRPHDCLSCWPVAPL